MTDRIPVDSADVRELAEQRDGDDRCTCQREHDAGCEGGWLGETPDGRIVPCLRCRPHLSSIHGRHCADHPISADGVTS